MVAESKTITNLKLDKVAMFCGELEASWTEAFMENRSVVNLKLANFANNYSYGDKFLMAIKRRQTRLHSLKLDNFRVNDQHLYYFTAVVRSHHFFDSLELSNKCFEELKDDKKQPLKDQKPNFEALNEVLSKKHGHLTIGMSDEHMYKGDKNAFSIAMQSFKGDWLTLKNGFIPDASLPGIFQGMDRLRYFEMQSVAVTKVKPMDDIFAALAKVPSLIGLKIVCKERDTYDT